jgi:hypothetical protein
MVRLRTPQVPSTKSRPRGGMPHRTRGFARCAGRDEAKCLLCGGLALSASASDRSGENSTILEILSQRSLAKVFPFRLIPAPDHPRDGSKERDQRNVVDCRHHQSPDTPILTPISMSSNPNIANPTAISTLARDMRSLRRKTSKGTNTSNRIPMSRIASPHSSYRLFPATLPHLYRNQRAL